MRRLGGLKALFCRGSKTKLSRASFEAELMETPDSRRYELALVSRASFEAELMET